MSAVNNRLAARGSSETCISPALAIARQVLPRLYLILAKEYFDLVKLRQFLAKFCLRRQKDIFRFNIFYSMTSTWHNLPHHLEEFGQPLAKVFSRLAFSHLHLACPRLECEIISLFPTYIEKSGSVTCP